MLPLIMTLAIVVEDQTVLRAAPEDEAHRSAVTWKGDWLEVRGETNNFVQVYDHRRERAGYVAPERIRRYRVEETSADSMLAVIDFLRESRGSESLGIGLVALYLRAAPSTAIKADVFDALGVFAERLARRASGEGVRPGDVSIFEHLEVARSYGIQLNANTDGTVCYEGEAFRRVLALEASEEQKARAAMALTDPRCASTREGSAEVIARWQAEVLDRVDVMRLSSIVGNRVRLRRAHVWSAVADGSARKGELGPAKLAFDRALGEIAGVDKSVLGSERPQYDEAAIRVAAARFAGEPTLNSSGLDVVAGAPGETCLEIKATEKEKGWRHCTYALVWASSIRRAPNGRHFVVAIEPLPGWVELWSISKSGKAAEWTIDTLVPAVAEPELGYVELAGFTPEGKLLVVREAKVGGKLSRTFQVLGADRFTVEKSAGSSRALSAFKKHATAEWRQSTLALR